MKLISIIGTRPQYIKVKSIYDYCNNNNIDHIIIDTNQHFSDFVSKNIIEDLNLKIDINLNVDFTTEIDFIAEASKKLEKILKKFDEDIFVLIYGDTNSSFLSAMTCYKNNIKFAHIEAGVRSQKMIPEEINRQYIDSISSLNFCITEKDLNNVNNSVLCGDLEYELLNNMKIKKINFEFGLMTVHRQENTNINDITKIFNFCERIKTKIILPIHHRLKNQSWFSEIKIPENLIIIDPLNYKDMVNYMASCKFILTDSGGVLKTCPFFGKKTLILRDKVGWVETIEKKYSKYCEFSEEDISFLDEKIKNDKYFYLNNDNPSKIIINNIKKQNLK